MVFIFTVPLRRHVIYVLILIFLVEMLPTKVGVVDTETVKCYFLLFKNLKYT